MKRSAIETSLKYQKYLQRVSKNSKKLMSIKHTDVKPGYVYDASVKSGVDPLNEIKSLSLSACNRLMTQYEGYRKIALDGGDEATAAKLFDTYKELASRRNEIIEDVNKTNSVIHHFGGAQ